MDQYNIIIPKDNIPELDMEMNQWLQLPMDFKLRSNDDCIRLHGCTVPEYYNFIKIGLIKTEDRAHAEISKSNLVNEQMSWSNNEIINGEKLMAQLMQNPYIVVISPNTNHQPELDDAYNNYLNLTSKNRRLSDYYSTEIWGINVQNMYRLLKASDETFQAGVEMKAKGEDQSNVKMDEKNPLDDITNDTVSPNPYKSNLTLVANVESVVSSYYDIINKSICEHTTLSKEIFKSWDECTNYPGINSNIIDNIIESSGLGLQEDEDKLYLPKYCPWFTLEEMTLLNIDPTIGGKMDNLDYYKAIKETYSNYRWAPSTTNKEKVLGLGWNPYIEPDKKAFEYAKERQADFISETINMIKENNIVVEESKEKLDYVILKPVNIFDTDTALVREVCLYYKNNI